MADPLGDDQTTRAAAQQTGAGVNPPLSIPDDIQKQFPDIVDLIVHSESMNDEERQYWINILPIMTPEQLKNLRDILTTERQQLAAIDAQYAKAIDTLGQEELVKKVGEERRDRAAERTAAESGAKTEEEKKAEELLKNIEGQ